VEEYLITLMNIVSTHTAVLNFHVRLLS
jgi:hypothetical protein